MIITLSLSLSGINSSRFFAATDTAFHATQFCTFSSQFGIPNFAKSCFILSIRRLFFVSPFGLFPVGFHSTAASRYSKSDLLITCPNHLIICAFTSWLSSDLFVPSSSIQVRCHT